ncbi:hypothetical protein BO71DRAFT_373032 [Aspergillus ellipticus CBS 707.79]|uniref:Uncharacterized protein n=1 Tax=Aspergillus ellipticus CBS 707.79 TaxID=1448320 RepID=A0A319DJE5_9EURO|nr:hypothetical protein BO71DRAFT_373032 [Aspergillus ellipticus CBS 707.79]
MARGTFLGRSRTLRQTEGISSPVLKHSDAQPRKDLKCVEDGAIQSFPLPPPTPRDFQRPDTSESRHKKKLQALSPGLITQYPPLPASPISSPTSADNAVNGSLIGVALGSPRLIESHNPLSPVHNPISSVQNPISPVQNPISPAQEAPAKPAEPQARPALQRKPSKWKKIGGLFKAKSALAAVPDQPFYQVRLENEWPMQGSTYSFDHQQKAKPEKSGSEKSVEKLPNGKSTEKLASPISEPPEAWPSIKSEVQPTAHEPKQQDATPAVPSQDKEQPPALGPLLQVEIPDIQLERYSVMFGGVLSKNRSPTFKRRSQTLEDVTASDTETSSTLPDLPPPPRRSSSPTRSKSPSFTLFPATQVSKASKVLGSQNIPRGPSPIHRSQASLAESRQENMSKEKSQVVLMVHQPSHKPQSSMSSFLSSTTIGSEDEELLLQKLKPVRNYFDAKEPEWEIINKKQEPMPEPPTLTINTQTCASSSETAKTESIPSPAAKTPVLDSAPREMKEFGSPTSPSKRSSPRSSPVQPTRMAIRDSNSTNATDPNPTEPAKPARAVEISIARSVSVSRGRKQVIVPIRPRSDRLDPNAVDRPLPAPPVPAEGEHQHHHPPRPRPPRRLRNAPVEMI